MPKKNIKKCFLEQNNYVSDKWSSYLPIYERYLSKFVDRQINLLEIGVQNGGSLEIWSRYFLRANKIIGCDINKKCSELRYEDNRITVISGDINLSQTHLMIEEKAVGFDLIIDDGSHMSRDIISTFKNFYPKLNCGGIYLVEDLHCSYWKSFGGGLLRKNSAVDFFKKLVDVINYESWGVSGFKGRTSDKRKFKNKINFKLEDFLSIQSIHFYNSVCVIIKGDNLVNTIGSRVLVGANAAVESCLPVSGSLLPQTPEVDNARRLGIVAKND